ncbi:hypothetical protein BGW36DRAFT_444464 [Talaromyces proteolyticus]|uniref:MYND-type domain-containing protein n=1 Tax=Talaromyces proteolyticus TaxID=1131652 RepID=A0AAD4Q2P8_9EURO|nr:uncharacterized protein BGW36DRAFT_444464 [Talaromyces proteolyticus]KAH8703907.1 hypothetical protein BGW36DRAFT_444464 [Talaromyces proteolyticus]
MLEPAHLRRASWFHPVGNTTPVCLTQTIPPDQNATVLMLGCGDIRNVLFTIYSDLNNRRIDFTCCDIEYEIIARNVMLYTLLLHKNNSEVYKNIFSIYYDVMINDAALKMLRWQARRLCQIASSAQGWNASPYAKYIRFLDGPTLWNCLQMWKTYCTSPINGNKYLEVQNGLRRGIATAQDLQSFFVEDRKSYYGIKATAPVSLYTTEVMALRYGYYWHRGTTKLSDPPSTPLRKGRVHMNPMFATGRPELLMHYGTDPYSSMHSSIAFMSLTKNSPLEPIGASNFDRLYDAAFTQFKAYAEVFRANSHNISIRVASADAIAFCHALQRFANLGDPKNSGWYRRGWGFEPMTLGYMRPGDHASFDVIDTSNLADHIGCLNLISAASPLLRPSHTSTLRVETAIIRDRQGPESGTDILGGHFAAMSSIFSLNCIQFWTQNSNTPIFPEHILADLPRSDFYSQSVYCRYAIEWRHMGVENKLRMEEEDLAQLIAAVYAQMFGDEDPESFKPRRHRYQQYTRASFAAVVGAIKKAVQFSDWDEILQDLMDIIKENNTLDARYKEDLYLQLHLQGLYTEERFRPLVSFLDNFQEMTGLMSEWTYIPSTVCLTMVIPRGNLSYLEEHFPSTALIGQICLMTKNIYNLSKYDCFQSVQLCFGTVNAIGKCFTDEYTVNVDADRTGKSWEGTSDLVASVIIPSWKLLEHPGLDFDVAFALRETTDSQEALKKEFGRDMIIFRDRVSGESVFLTGQQPHMSGTMWVPNLNPVASHSNPPIQFQPRYYERDLTGNHDYFRPDLDTSIETPARTLVNDTPILVKCISAFQHIIQAPGWNSGEKTEVELFLPMPVISEISSSEPIRPVCGKLTYSAYMSTVEWLFKQPNTLFPVFLDQGKPILQNLHYINLDKLPILSLSQNYNYAWLQDHITSTMSYKEQVANHKKSLQKRRALCDVRVRFKNSLFHIFQVFLQYRPARVPFVISNKTEGLVYLICPSNLRLDLSNKTIVLDCIVAHLNKQSLPYLRPWLEGPSAREFERIKVRDDELLIWKHTLPAFAERCRTWCHTADCEYQSVKKIPPSTEIMQPGAFCSCAYAFSRDSSYDLGDEQIWSCVRPHAVRVALTLPFPFPFGPANVGSDVEMWEKCVKPRMAKHPMHGKARDVRWCLSCGRTEDKEKVELEVCGGCKKVWYCSEICVHWDWYYGGHKLSCRRLRKSS